MGLRKWSRQIVKKSLFDQMVEHSQSQKNNLMPLQKQRMWKIFHILCFCIQFHTRVYSAFPMFIMINDTFDCQFCGQNVSRHPQWSARNHCPYCLSSLHVDLEFPGDRASDCGWEMRAIGLESHSKKWWMIVHECIKCRAKNRNIVASDDKIDKLYSKMNPDIPQNTSRYA